MFNQVLPTCTSLVLVMCDVMFNILSLPPVCKKEPPLIVTYKVVDCEPLQRLEQQSAVQELTDGF